MKVKTYKGKRPNERGTVKTGKISGAGSSGPPAAFHFSCDLDGKEDENPSMHVYLDLEEAKALRQKLDESITWLEDRESKEWRWR